ncbi:hypothetical protein FBZ94_10761 [Bradyrhizobium sacchari]|uniref:Uncharacterized protein n=1 Tax=Bradyrhizobium sacchari TaxID=1399419 RepID=A0A560K7F2_9BRAD|nr:hypothetical protein FBZ94_10761 [Bradyrhizobium sacchari]TWB79146.1 hypothetical protein FBZ95_103998 [Bradyrhizobium sacchari]
MLRCARNDGVCGHRHTSTSSRLISPELCLITPPSKPRGRREDRVPTSHPRSAARRCSAKEPHSSIQVVPITRPSLRDGRTAYAVLSREPNSLWPPSRPRNAPAARRLTQLPPPQELDRSNDGQDHTVLPYARPAISPQYSQPRRQSRKLANETKPSSAVRPHAVSSSQGLPALPAPLVPDAAASTASPGSQT